MTKSRNLFRTSLTIFSICIGYSLTFAQSNLYKDTIWVPVTFYDFHSNKSNPEFEQNIYSGVRTGMVRDTLDADKKPILTTDAERINRNAYIKYWFRPWQATPGDPNRAQGDMTYPTYEDNQDMEWGRYLGDATATHDTSFKNIVIEDSLPFLHMGGGVYQYKDDGDPGFFPLDGRGFGNEGLNHNFSFTMELHWTFTKVPGLAFSFTGDDDVWAFIDNQLRLDLGGRHGAANGSFELDNIPGLENGKRYSLDFFFAERHTTGSNILITTNLITPNIVDISLEAQPNTTVPVYETVKLLSAVTDDTSDTPGNRTEVASKTQWRVIDLDGNPPGILKSDSGSEVILVPELAYTTIVVEGTVTEGEITLRDTIRITVGPGKPYAVSIEADSINLSTADTSVLQKPQPLDQIVITNSMTTAGAYAVVRDSSGAFVRMADPATSNWFPPPPAGDGIIHAVGEDLKKWHGIITRIDSGSTYAHAIEGTLLSDSVRVIVAPYDIVSLRVVERGNNPLTYVESIRMSTDEKKTYDVYGLKSTATDPNDPNSWVLVNADWELSPPLNSANQPPKGLSYWTYDPTNPGTGTLTVSNPNDANTEALVLPVTIDRAPPSIVDFKLITPQAQRIAGDTLLAVVKISNTDGLVPGRFCFGTGGDDPSQVVYRDTLGKGGDRRPEPNIVVNDIPGNLNTGNSTLIANDQCFDDGLDTVKVVLYNASPDSMHQLVVTLNSGLTARTEPFELYPAALDSIVLTYEDFTPIPGQVTLDSRKNESITTYAAGYDRFGNLRGYENSTWATDGTLDSLNTFGTRIYIGTDNITDHQQGNLCASAAGRVGPVSACIPIRVIGRGADLAEAITRDINGNGYLDRVDLTFNKNTFVPRESVNNFTINHNNNTYQIDSIVPQTPGDSLHYHVYLKELQNKVPQSAWKLTVNIAGMENVNPVSNFQTKDGAPPVVWYVNKKIVSLDHKKDVLQVLFSENIFDHNGNAFTIFAGSPDSILNVWQKNATGQLEISSLLDEIAAFTFSDKDSVALITTNGRDITDANLVNIRFETLRIQDESGNRPDEQNQKVRVVLSGEIVTINPYPNPMTPGFNYTPPGQLNLIHEENAPRWAKSVGTAFNVILTPPDSGKIYGYLKVYDAVGNLVNYSVKTDIIASAQAKGLVVDGVSLLNLWFYWNGSTYKGAKASPGVYKVILYLDYEGKFADGTKCNDQVLPTKVGIAR